MNKALKLITFFFSLTFFLHAQTGKITGTIVDGKTGETLPGATIMIEGTTKGASADFDGNFSINSVNPGTYNLIVSYITYDNKKLSGVVVKANDVTNLNVTLEQSSSQTLGEVVVQVEMNKENTNTLLIMQKNNVSVSDGVSSETIKRTPDRNTSDVLKRVSGASIQDNKFAIIRGLSDRYNAAYINGAPLPSSESDRKAFSFDIFPSNMLDNLVIIKTATPDMPGEFAGGIIQINTKSIPDKNFNSFTVGGGYNTITTGKEQYSYKGGKYDWLGMDDGTRALPKEIPSQKDYSPLISDQAKYATYMKNDWVLNKKSFSPNLNLQYTMGHTFKLKDRDFFGVIVSLTYNRNNNYFETQRNSFVSSTDLSVPSQQENSFLDKTYSSQVLAGALANLSCKINDNNTISFKNLYSINSDDRVIRRTGTREVLESNPTYEQSDVQWFTGNKIYTGQLIGEHFIPKAKIKASWVGSYSKVQRDIPDLRRTSYSFKKNFDDPANPNPYDTTHVANIAYNTVGPSYGGGRFYSNLNEYIYSFKGDLSYSFKVKENFKNEIKIGGYMQSRNRTFYARQLGYIKYGPVGSSVSFNQNLLTLPADQIFATQNLGLIEAPSASNGGQGVGGFALKDATKPTDSYIATSSLQAAYLMLDNRYKDKLRLIWGARVENFKQTLNAPVDAKTPNLVDTTVLDILPSANLIWSVTEKQNIRLCYSQTVNRPEFRELAPFAFYEFNTQFVYSGNPNLKRAKVQNYDLRYEIYPGRGQLFSVTGFYKSFENPIEQVSRADVQGEVSFSNVPKAKNYGAELEFRVVIGALFKADSSKFLNNLTVYSNFAYIKSEVDVSTVTTGAKTRALQGQSPYIFNAGILYSDMEHGFSVSAAVNRVGQRIAIVGNVNEPDIWENGRTVLDIQLGKSFLKNNALDIKLNLRDALAQKQYFFQDRNNNNKLDKKTDDLIWITKFGPTISLNITYKF
ncbi:MAG: TonB-dependent receptor [Bacteroidetes bacterium]|nr:TonB-dependent receptor [Bacteroidota bacterium]